MDNLKTVARAAAKLVAAPHLTIEDCTHIADAVAVAVLREVKKRPSCGTSRDCADHYGDPAAWCWECQDWLAQFHPTSPSAVCGVYFKDHPGTCDLLVGHDGPHHFTAWTGRSSPSAEAGEK